MNITIPAQALAVIRLFAADDKDIRKYLHGVCLELGATESLCNTEENDLV